VTTTTTPQRARIPGWLGWLLPVAAIAALVALFLIFNPIGSLREVPPVEVVAVERTVLSEDEITLELRNDGPDPVTIAQVLVNEPTRATRSPIRLWTGWRPQPCVSHIRGRKDYRSALRWLPPRA